MNKKHFKNQTIKLVRALPQHPKVLSDFTWFVSMLFFKGALTYFLGCVAKEYVCGITWTFFATHRSFYNTALVINIEIEQ